MKTKIDQFIDLLKAYNMHTNIYSEKAYDKLPFHIDDSKVLAGLISNKPLTVFDFGSGSGLPSAIIAILNPNNTVYAIESKSRKSKFLCQVAESLSLTNYKIVNQNIIEFARESRPKPDIITAKAFGPIEKTLDFAKRF
ncbi:MAG: 16S rRNA (guanine527-N7)-methyltransferase, partial [Candidatus Marinamargulisbacteria bacterium]